MTDEEINQVIAEHLNWEVIHDGYGVFPAGRAGEVPLQRIPDYANDLNAMHLAWMTLDEIGRGRFANRLCEMFYELHPEPNIGWLLGATARQRAEAFLRAIGKWSVKP